MKKICPLITMAIIISKNRDGNPCCEKDACVWYDSKVEECIIHALKGISYHLKNISNK